MIFLTLCSLFVVDNLLLYYICFEMSLFSASTLNQLTIVVCRDRSDDESTPNSSTPVKGIPSKKIRQLQAIYLLVRIGSKGVVMKQTTLLRVKII
jgi:hypothetical protein